jgi:hypothetical protein
VDAKLAAVTRANLAQPSEVIDKRGLLGREAGLRLDLGCGQRKAGQEYVGIDLLDAPCVDVVGEVLAALSRIRDGVVDRVYSSHFLEHVEDVDTLLTEVARVMSPGAELEVIVPHFSNPYFYSDLTHRHAFGLYSFSYLIPKSPFKRKVPTYGNELPFRLDQVVLGFKSAPPFYGRYVFKRLAQLLFNASRGMREFYEENLCYLVPCYEVRYLLVRS